MPGTAEVRPSGPPQNGTVGFTLATWEEAILISARSLNAQVFGSLSFLPCIAIQEL